MLRFIVECESGCSVVDVCVAQEVRAGLLMWVEPSVGVALRRVTILENVGRSSGSIFQHSCIMSYLRILHI